MRHLLWMLGVALAVGLLICVGASTPNAAAAPAGPQGTAVAAAAPDGPAMVPVVQEGFEHGALNTTQFVSAVATCVPGGCGWTQDSMNAHDGIHSVYAPDVAGVADQQLVLNSAVAIPADATSAGLTFWQRYGFEQTGVRFYDGGVFEVSTDDGATWADGAGLLTHGGYNTTLLNSPTNPLGGRPAWGGAQSQWTQVQADLMLYRGRTLRIRLRLGTDDSNAASQPGWWVDDVLLSFQATQPCAPAYWNAASAYPTAIADVAVSNLGYEPYVFGGLGTTVSTAAYRYQLESHTWLPLAPLPAARFLAATAENGQNIYILGGRDAGLNPTNTLYRYNPGSDDYTTLAPLSTSVYEAGLVTLGGKLYRVGGVSSGVIVNTVEAYDIAGNTWTPLAPVPQGVANTVVTSYGAYIYVVGGLTGAGTATAKAYRYNPATNTWSDAAIADLPSPRSDMAGGAYNDNLMVAGGQGASGLTLSSVLAWDPTSNKWNSRAQLPAPHAGPGTSLYDTGYFYLPGGQDATGDLTSTVQYYNAPACATPTPGPTATPCLVHFSDVHNGDYYYTPVLDLACHGVISGYGDGTFRPFANTTRGQLTKIVVLGFGKPIHTPPAGQYSFADVPPSQPFYAFVETAFYNQIISGYACGGPGEPCDTFHRSYFHPSANVTRGQLSKIIVGAAQWPLHNPANASFADVASGSPFYKYVETAACYGVVSGYTCGGAGEPCDPNQRSYFRTGNNATRGQIAKIVYGAAQGPIPCYALKPGDGGP